MKTSKPSWNSCSPWSYYPKTQKNQTVIFGPFFQFFRHFTILRARISGKHGPKVKIFAKFEFSVSDLPIMSKIAPKKLFWPIFIFCCHFWQSDTWFSDHSSEIPHRTGSSGVSFDRAHVGAHQSHLCQIAHVPVVKYNLFSKFKIVIFWRFFDLDPTWIFDLQTMFPESGHGYTHTKFQFCSFTLTRSKTAVT
jgi:hypothetical protein